MRLLWLLRLFLWQWLPCWFRGGRFAASHPHCRLCCVVRIRSRSHCRLCYIIRIPGRNQGRAPSNVEYALVDHPDCSVECVIWLKHVDRPSTFKTTKVPGTLEGFEKSEWCGVDKLVESMSVVEFWEFLILDVHVAHANLSRHSARIETSIVEEVVGTQDSFVADDFLHQPNVVRIALDSLECSSRRHENNDLADLMSLFDESPCRHCLQTPVWRKQYADRIVSAIVAREVDNDTLSKPVSQYADCCPHQLGRLGVIATTREHELCSVGIVEVCQNDHHERFWL